MSRHEHPPCLVAIVGLPAAVQGELPALPGLTRFMREVRVERLVVIGASQKTASAIGSCDGQSPIAAGQRQVVQALRGCAATGMSVHLCRVGKATPSAAPADHLRDTLDCLEVEALPCRAELAPGWILACGQGSPSSSSHTARLRLARTLRRCFIGVDGPLRLMGETTVKAGVPETVWDFRIGRLPLLGHASRGRERGGACNAGFAVLQLDDAGVTPHPIPMRPDGSFAAFGRTYR